MTESELERALRMSPNHIITRVSDRNVQIDVRTLIDGDNDRIIKTLSELEIGE